MIGIISKNITIKMENERTAAVYPKEKNSALFSKFLLKGKKAGTIDIEKLKNYPDFEVLNNLSIFVERLIEYVNDRPELRKGFTSFSLMIRGELKELEKIEFSAAFYNEQETPFPITIIYSDYLLPESRLFLGLNPSVDVASALKLRHGRDCC
ncbi:MAG: hypothetical protein ACK4J0_02370 [Candidatus Anstonellaceae archaeon]